MTTQTNQPFDYRKHRETMNRLRTLQAKRARRTAQIKWLRSKIDADNREWILAQIARIENGEARP